MDSRKKVNIKDYLKRKNVKRFSIFFAIAFVFLIFSKLSNDYKQTLILEIKLVNLEDETILESDSLNLLNAVVQAKGFALVPYIFNNSKTIVLDANNDVASNPNHYTFDVKNHRFLIEDQLGSPYKLLSVKPDTLILPYSKQASKYVPLILKTDLDFSTGFDVYGSFNKSADSVKIVGAVEVLDTITAIETEVLKLSGVNTNINDNVIVSAPTDMEVFPKSINITAEVKRFTEGKIDVPVTIINTPMNTEINFFPKSVSLSYYVDLENYNNIEVSDFSVECNYNDIEGSQGFLVPKIVKRPKSIKRISIKQKRIDFIKL